VPGIKVCGKTGTAQNPRGGDHSWFVSFAPLEKPQIVIAVIVENAVLVRLLRLQLRGIL